eukprot:15440372-Alexandrium_andersonii.AAC.1
MAPGSPSTPPVGSFPLAPRAPCRRGFRHAQPSEMGDAGGLGLSNSPQALRRGSCSWRVDEEL